MRPSIPVLRRLALAALTLLIIQLAYEQVTFPARFHAPIRWNGLDGGGTAARASGATFARVQGMIFQQAELLHGAYRPLRISFRYRSTAGAWMGVQGDATRGPVSELAITAPPPFHAPTISSESGLYRINLPPAAGWRSATLTIREHTDLPFLTVILGAASKIRPAYFSDVSLVYANASGLDLLDNSDFSEPWPVWAIHPEWINPLYAACQSGAARQNAPASSPLDPLWPTSWTAIIVLAIAGGVLVWKLNRSRGCVPVSITAAVWVTLSALLILGSQTFPDLSELGFARPSLAPARVLGGILAWAIQLGCFYYVGVAGYRLIGDRARFFGLLIALFGASMIASTVGIMPENGLPQPIIDNVRFLEGLGPVWLFTGAAAVWIGAHRAASSGAGVVAEKRG
ncbi:MAG TPA: hypothetical protein VFJ58_21150 [Armatimonadota bacterium]|nr:hypothetical protein [Armatimonadota bacterium]